MKKLILSLVLVAGIVVCGTAMASTPVTGEKESVTASVTLEGNPYVDVRAVDDSTLTSIGWSGVTLGTTGWKAADQLLKITYLLPAGGSVNIYTENTDDKVGLVGEDGSTLPTSWRIFNSDADATAAERTIYEWLYDETVEGKDLNGDGDMLDKYVSKLTNQTPKPASDSIYPCWLWMKDGPIDEDYVRVVTPSGIHHAEGNNWGWGGSPDYIAIGADFTRGTPQTYSASIMIELYQP